MRSSWAFLLLGLAFAPPLEAAPQQKPSKEGEGTFEVEPSYTALEVVPGKATPVRLTMRTLLPSQKVFLEPVDFSIDRQGRVTTTESRDKKYSGKAWCRLTSSEVEVRQGADLTVDVPIIPPVGTPGGEYFMGINTSTPPMDRVQPDGTNVTFR
jgi:hypothetical protein